MRRILFSLFLASMAVVATAQDKVTAVAGKVVDSVSGEELVGASVQLHSLPDTVLVVGSATDLEGNFSLSVKPGNYMLRVFYLGYVTKESDMKVSAGKKSELGKILLEQDAVALKEAMVTAEVPPVTASGDTLVYNTAAFRVAEGSMLEELIKKYPGVTIEDDGTIKLNGKTVNRILMKGKDFFGTDKDMALKNISVDAVDKIKFYDKKSDFSRITGIDDGEEETVLDLQMKQGVADGFFSNTDAGYGTVTCSGIRQITITMFHNIHWCCLPTT